VFPDLLLIKKISLLVFAPCLYVTMSNKDIHYGALTWNLRIGHSKLNVLFVLQSCNIHFLNKERVWEKIIDFPHNILLLYINHL